MGENDVDADRLPLESLEFNPKEKTLVFRANGKDWRCDLDDNVPPESTYRFADALIKARKDFDFLVVPGGRHERAGGSYGQRRLEDFFVHHLLGREPPNRNGGSGGNVPQTRSAGPGDP